MEILPSDDQHIWRLRETLREAERVIDFEARNFEALDRKSEQMITVAMAVLAGGAALSGFIVQGSRHADVVFVLLLSFGGWWTVASVAALLNAYVGFGRHLDVYIGPRIDWLVEKTNDPGWTMADHLVTVIADFARYHTHHVSEGLRVAGWRRLGLFLLLGGLSFFTSAFLYRVARRIV